MSQSITVHPIGVVHSPYKQAKGTPIQGTFNSTWIELAPQYALGLKGLDDFSHAILLYYFSLSDKEQVVSCGEKGEKGSDYFLGLPLGRKVNSEIESGDAASFSIRFNPFFDFSGRLRPTELKLPRDHARRSIGYRVGR